MEYTLANIFRELGSRGLFSSVVFKAHAINLAEKSRVTTQNNPHLAEVVSAWINLEITSQELLFEAYTVLAENINRPAPVGVRAPREQDLPRAA